MSREVEWSSRGTVEEAWGTVAECVRRCAREVLGVTRKGKCKVEKESWWWGEEVQEAVKKKRVLYREWRKNKGSEAWRKYREGCSIAKKVVACEKAKGYKELYDNLGTGKGEKRILKIAKQRERKRRDVEKVKWVKDEQGSVIVEEGKIRERWEQYFCTLMNEGAVGSDEQMKETVLRRGVKEVTVEELERALRNMKRGKAVGPDEIPVEVWRLMGRSASCWLKDLFNRMLAGEPMPKEWRVSALVPLYKGKGDVQECSNYRGIKLLSLKAGRCLMLG